MARRRRARDTYANRYRARFTFPAAATTGVWTSFNTGMNVAQMPAFKWDILWVDVMPENASLIAGDPGMASNIGCHFQLCVGTQTAILNSDDAQVVCSGGQTTDIATSGGGPANYPLPLNVHSPIPVIASVMTMGAMAANNAGFNSKVWYFEIGYVIRQTSSDEVTEILASQGTL